jgi:hypothetical protein
MSKYSEALRQDGFVKIPEFFDYKSEILPIQNEIRQIIEIVSTKLGVHMPELDDFAELNKHFNKLKQASSLAGGIVYDAMKHLNGLHDVVSNRKVSTFLKSLWPDGLPKAAAYSAGIRINHPDEPRFLAPWHQELHYQGRAMRGMVLWMPLVEATSQLGPVQFCKGSHHGGALKVYKDTNPETIYDIEIYDLENILNKYEIVSMDSQPGDVIFADFLTIHRSGINRSNVSLWSIQARYFDMLDQKGIEMNWAGPGLQRADTEALFPELMVKS